MLDLQRSVSGEVSDTDNQLSRKYGLFTTVCMVVGIVIGSGVFFKAQTILQKTGGNMPLGILAWIIGGAIMLVCLLTFSFMGQKYEKVNGLVDYAEATVGPRYGYMMGWFSATIYFPGMTSALAWVSARYTLVFITSAFPNFPMTIPVEQGYHNGYSASMPEQFAPYGVALQTMLTGDTLEIGGDLDEETRQILSVITIARTALPQ